MILSRSSEYAIELILYLKSHNSKNYAPLNVIADKTGLSFHYLSKIARILTQKRIIKSYRGPNGGVALAKPIENITLFDIVDAIEGDAFLNQCILRLSHCGEDNPCPIHESWIPIRENMRTLFMSTTLENFNETQIENDLVKEN